MGIKITFLLIYFKQAIFTLNNNVVFLVAKVYEDTVHLLYKVED